MGGGFQRMGSCAEVIADRTIHRTKARTSPQNPLCKLGGWQGGNLRPDDRYESLYLEWQLCGWLFDPTLDSGSPQRHRGWRLDSAFVCSGSTRVDVPLLHQE